MKVIICHCLYCKSRRAYRRRIVKAKKHSHRSIVRQLLRERSYDKILPFVNVGYTD